MRPSPSGLPVPLVGRCLALSGLCLRRSLIRPSPNGGCAPLSGLRLRVRRIWMLPCERCLPPNGLCLRLREMCTRRCAICLRLRRVCLSPSGLLAPRVGRCTLRPLIPSSPKGLCPRPRGMCTRRCAIGGTRARPAMPPWRSAVRRRPTDCCAACTGTAPRGDSLIQAAGRRTMPRLAVGVCPSVFFYAPAVPRGLRLCGGSSRGHALRFPTGAAGWADRAFALPPCRGVCGCAAGASGGHAFYYL